MVNDSPYKIFITQYLMRTIKFRNGLINDTRYQGIYSETYGSLQNYQKFFWGEKIVISMNLVLFKCMHEELSKN